MDKKAIIEAYQSNHLLGQIFESVDFVHGSAKNQIQALCVELHNEGAIDLLGMIGPDKLQDLEGHNFFLGQNFFNDVIPHLDAPVEEMMRVVGLLVEKGGADLLANEPNGAFKRWCAADLTRAQSVIEVAKRGDELAKKFLTFALSANEDVSEAIGFVEGYSDSRRLSGVVALGRMTWEERARASEALSAFARALQRDPDDQLRLNVLIAALDIATKTDTHDRDAIVSLVKSICAASDSVAIFACARALCGYGKTLDEGIILLLLERLKSLDPQERGTIDALDHGLWLLLNTANSKHAVAFVKSLLASSGDTLSLTDFDSFGNAFFSCRQSGSTRFLCPGCCLEFPLCATD
jgi:hypothetical protein